ncbi:MAG TPA: 6-carboxytetrahydropterin synthase [Polyangia bacterium]
MAQFKVAVLRDFVAQHFLFGGDWGRENQLHSHHYKLEAIFEGDALDRHNYLLDIAVVSDHLDALVERYRDKTLNSLPEFEGQNPSLELFARLLNDGLRRSLPTEGLNALSIKLWEHEQAFAVHTHSFR